MKQSDGTAQPSTATAKCGASRSCPAKALYGNDVQSSGFASQSLAMAVRRGANPGKAMARPRREVLRGAMAEQCTVKPRGAKALQSLVATGEAKAEQNNAKAGHCGAKLSKVTPLADRLKSA